MRCDDGGDKERLGKCRDRHYRSLSTIFSHIVVYSKTFEDHLKHVDMVLKAIMDAGITLSPPKCHLGYQSLQLLGQRVSRLGLSAHKEKVDAINQIAEPRNVHELQMFLGMMVYFIPFYCIYSFLCMDCCTTLQAP